MEEPGAVETPLLSKNLTTFQGKREERGYSNGFLRGNGI